MSSELVATSSSRHWSPAQVVCAVVAAAAVVMLATGLVHLAAGRTVDGVVFVVVGPSIVVVALVVLLRLRRAEPTEVRVDASGLAVGPGDALRRWAWDDVRALYVVGGAVRLLVVEDDTTTEAERRRPGPHRSLRWLGVAPPSATTVLLNDLVPGELEVLTAVREASGGRFPDAEVRPRRPYRGHA